MVKSSELPFPAGSGAAGLCLLHVAFVSRCISAAACEYFPSSAFVEQERKAEWGKQQQKKIRAKVKHDVGKKR